MADRRPASYRPKEIVMAHQLDAAMQQCIDHCQSCERICFESITHCLGLGGAHAEAAHIGLLQACAEICGTSARFMLLESPQHPQVCGVCADVCDACARDCDRLGDDEHMRRCAEACRTCAESCRSMSGQRTRTAGR
jgi:hypothetical protein